MANELERRRTLMNKTLQDAKKIIEDSPMMLAAQGIQREHFAEIVREAIIANPDIITCSETSLAQAFRKCCRDGIVPDGLSGAIVPFGQEAVALTMVNGYKRMAHEGLGAEIREGAILDGDEIRITQGVGIKPTLEVIIKDTSYFTASVEKPVVGSYCWLKLPHEEWPRLYLYRLNDIERARAASRAQNGPWKVWPDRMAVKSVINSAIRSLRYLRDARSELLFRAVEDDIQAEFDQAHARGHHQGYVLLHRVGGKAGCR